MSTAEAWIAGITHEAPLTPDELAAIKADIYADPLLFSDDRQVMPDLLKKAIDTLGVLALAGHEGAAQGLRDLQGRVLSGVPFGTPQEPAWSLDPDIRLPRRGE